MFCGMLYLEKHPCVDCGETDPVVLQFDHVRGEKTLGISVMMANSRNWDSILPEIAKCEVRCANCHTRRTAQTQGWYKSLSSSG